MWTRKSDHRNSATTTGCNVIEEEEFQPMSEEELAAFNRKLKKEDDEARTDRYFQDLNEAMTETIRDFRFGRAQAEDVQRFFPGYSEWDIHRRFGDTDEGTNLRFPSAPPSFKRLEEFEPAPHNEIDDYGPDGRVRRESELQLKNGGFVDLTEKDLELLAQAKMGPLRIMGEGASNEYGSGLGGRVLYNKELDKYLALQAYLEGFAQKQKGEKATGEITGGGVRLIKRFEKGGLVDEKTSREMANTKFDQLFVESGQKYGVDPAILKAIASVESSFRPNIRGPRTRHGQAQGLMQFIPATAKAYGLDDPFDPAKSIDAAARLMRDNIKMFKGDVGKALEAYNGGPRLVGKSRQTAEYRDKVLQRSQYAGFGASPTQVAQQLAPTTPTSARPSLPARVGGERVGLSALSTLPMNYQAALALQYLTDTDPEGNPEEQAEQALLDLERSAEKETGPTIQQALASQQEALPSPFEVFKRRKPEKKGKTLPPLSVVMGFNKGGEARSDDLEDLATQMTFGTLPSYAKDSKAVKEGLKKSGQDIVRGIKFFPADLIGAPVDIVNLALTPFGLGSDKPFMGSDYLINKGVEAGIYEKPSGSGVETLTRMAGLPASALRGAMRAMQKGEETLGKGIDLVKGSKFPETAPEGAIKPPTPGASFSFMPTEEMPFVGRIDKHVANLPYPVQKEAFINSLKGKFKGYEVDRVQEALEGIPANQKLTSSDLLNALQQNQFYNPSNYKVEIIPRGVIPAPEIWGGVDIKFRPTHVYPADPNKFQIGVIHLRHNRPEVAQLEELNKIINFGYKYPRIDLSPLELMSHSAYYRDADELSNAHKAMQNWQEELAKTPGVTKEQVEKVRAAVANFPAKAEEAFKFAAVSRTLANDPLTITAHDNFVGRYTSASLREVRKKAEETFGKDQRNRPEVFREVSIAALKQLEDYGFDIPLMLNATNINNRRGEIDMTSWTNTNHNARDLGLLYDSDKIKALSKNLVQVGYKPLPDGRRVMNLMDSEDYKEITKKYRWEKSLRELANKNPQAFKDLTELVGHLASNHKAILLASHPDIAAKMADIDNQQVINAFRTTALEMGYPQSFPTELIFPGQEVKAALGNIQESFADRIKNARELDFQKLSAHSSLRPPKDAISFSRFIAVYDETNPVDFSSPMSRARARQGIHITELQSDRRKLAEHLGTPKENPQTDIPKIAKLEEKLAAAEAPRDAYLEEFIKNKPQFASDPKDDLIKLLKFTDPDFAKLEEKVKSANNLLQHVKARPSLVGKNAPFQSDYKLPIYGVQESFPGMGTRGEDLQILMMKAAVDGAVRQGAQFVTFPGPESGQPQLYELVEKNMRSLVKELGPPFRIEEVTLRSFDPKNPDNVFTAFVKKPAIVWDKTTEAEKTIKKGIPFAKGGLVSMQQIHNWV